MPGHADRVVVQYARGSLALVRLDLSTGAVQPVVRDCRKPCTVGCKTGPCRTPARQTRASLSWGGSLFPQRTSCVLAQRHKIERHAEHLSRGAHSYGHSESRRLVVGDNETRAWQAWKITCGTVLVIALLLTVVHLVMGL